MATPAAYLRCCDGSVLCVANVVRFVRVESHPRGGTYADTMERFRHAR
ncbi:hypothetical protein RSSM_05086 [Rhodopirellula sallentina SM41]|uniref:Uncharacterized protein n=1 Tax=Rhodopirellula sallentina SM41 TaxID=1263870 RepID=M5TWB9_9BACT|nr:hypothetical protein RSSM_05086 [Rhodopirellula sallentina SM41]